VLDKLPNAVKIGSVQVKYADGTEHTLPIHGIGLLQFLSLCDELGVKNFDELVGVVPTLQTIRFMTRAAAQALTFDKIQDVWNVERITESLQDLEQICKVWVACVSLSMLPQPPSTTTKPSRKMTPYH
jgi:secreted Zn-dependent insulinase-like peptidase